jgi:hypothetical protein
MATNPSIFYHFHTNDCSLGYGRLKMNIFSDTMFSSVKSSRENTRAELYCSNLQWMVIYPMKSKEDVQLALSSFMSMHGAPDFIISDGAEELTGGAFRRKVREADVHCKRSGVIQPLVNYG